METNVEPLTSEAREPRHPVFFPVRMIDTAFRTDNVSTGRRFRGIGRAIPGIRTPVGPGRRYLLRRERNFEVADVFSRIHGRSLAAIVPHHGLLRAPGATAAA